MTINCFILSNCFSSRRNLNHRGAELTRQTETPGRRAQVRQTKSLFCLRFIIPCTISTLPVKSNCGIQLQHYVWRAAWPGALSWNCCFFYYYYFQKWHILTAARGWTQPFPLKCSTSLTARSLRSWLTSQKGENSWMLDLCTAAFGSVLMFE